MNLFREPNEPEYAVGDIVIAWFPGTISLYRSYMPDCSSGDGLCVLPEMIEAARTGERLKIIKIHQRDNTYTYHCRGSHAFWYYEEWLELIQTKRMITRVSDEAVKFLLRG